MANIIIKNYEHYNRAFKNWNTPRGRYISSKSDYEKALKEEGMISEKEADSQGFHREAQRKDYKVSSETLGIIEAVKGTADKKGRIRPGDRAIEALGKKFNYNRNLLPKHYQDIDKGGFN